VDSGYLLSGCISTLPSLSKNEGHPLRLSNLVSELDRREWNGEISKASAHQQRSTNLKRGVSQQAHLYVPRAFMLRYLSRMEKSHNKISTDLVSSEGQVIITLRSMEAQCPSNGRCGRPRVRAMSSIQVQSSALLCSQSRFCPEV